MIEHAANIAANIASVQNMLNVMVAKYTALYIFTANEMVASVY